MSKNPPAFYTFWVIDVMQHRMSVKAACFKHKTNKTQAYKWLKKHPKIREEYLQTIGKRARWKDEKAGLRPKNVFKNPSKAERRAHLALARQVKREALQERRGWLWMLLQSKPPVKMKRLLQQELAGIEKELKRG